MTPSRIWIILGAINAIIAIAAGAYSAHGITDDKAATAMATAAQYHMWHSFALFIIAWLCGNADDLQMKWFKRAGWLFIAGILFFSGSLYGFALTGSIPFPLITPLGGFSFILGWASLAVGAFKFGRKPTSS